MAVMQAAGWDRRSRANVTRLAAAQALAGANATTIYATGAIIGNSLAPSPAFATVPISVFVVGMALGTLPAGWLARDYGRRAAFLAGGACGVRGADPLRGSGWPAARTVQGARRRNRRGV